MENVRHRIQVEMVHRIQHGSSSAMKYPQELYDRAKKQIAEIDQIFNDINHWNNEHPGELVNPDPDGQLRMLKRNLETILRK